MDDDLIHAVEQARAGDADAVRLLVSEYDSAMRRIAHNIAHNREDAHDAVQEAWIVVVQRLSTLRERYCQELCMGVSVSGRRDFPGLSSA